MKKSTLFLLSAVVLAFASCSESDPAEQPQRDPYLSLGGFQWGIQSIYGTYLPEPDKYESEILIDYTSDDNNWLGLIYITKETGESRHFSDGEVTEFEFKWKIDGDYFYLDRLPICPVTEFTVLNDYATSMTMVLQNRNPEEGNLTVMLKRGHAFMDWHVDMN